MATDRLDSQAAALSDEHQVPVPADHDADLPVPYLDNN
jgi:hypothetical protein